MELKLPPGIVRTQSESAAMGRFIDGQWIRFVPEPEKIGGCEEIYTTVLSGVPRTAFTWDGPNGLEFRAFATESKLYAADFETEPTSITPLRTTAAALANNPFATTISSTRVVVTHTGHGAALGDTVIFHGATAGGGITISGSYTIDEYLTANTYAINHSSAATSTSAATGGAAVTADYELSIGTASASLATGYGTGTYGSSTYGTPRTLSTLVLEGRQWSLGNYGADLIAAYQGSRIYLYDDDTMDRATVLANSPVDVRFAFVTEERYIMALCTDMYLKWPDRDDPTDWTPSETNTANSRRLAAGNHLMAGCVLGGGVSLIWTDTSLYLAQFIGGAFIYDTRVIATGCGLAGPGAFCTADGAAFWTDGTRLLMFANSVVPIPNIDDVAEWFAQNITQEHKAKCFSYFNTERREVWWEFPAFGASECSHYVAVNVDHWHWTSGETPADMVRSCATNNSDHSRIIKVSPDGHICQHEIGVDADGASIPWSLTTGLFNSKDASRAMDIMGFVLDAEVRVGDIEATFRAQQYPDTPPETQAKTLVSGEGRADLRLSGHYFGFALSQDVVGGNYHGGKNILIVQPGGAR